MISIDSLFQAETYRDLRKPLCDASTLPPGCYTQDEFYRREIERVFKRYWQFICREEQVGEAGAYLCYDGPGGPVIIVRGREGRLRAFANSCRHRGSRLLSGSGQCKRIVCPYHSWSYDLNGLLIGTPGMESINDFAARDFPLLELRLDSWAGFVFIHYQPDPAPLSEHLGSMRDKFAAHRCDAMRFCGSLEFEIASNWKLLAENALEAYHTGSVHRDTLGQQQASQFETRGNWTGLLIKDEQSVATLQGDDKPFPHIEGLDAQAAGGAYFTLLYPSTQFVFAQDCMWWLAFQPRTVDRTRLSIGACFPRSTIELPDFEKKVTLYFKRWQNATMEDNAICEQQQQGQTFERPPGRFAAGEFAVHAFSNWLIDQMV